MLKNAVSRCLHHCPGNVFMGYSVPNHNIAIAEEG
jgi:hypothetical protein